MKIVNFISVATIPFVVLIIISYGLLKKVKIYDTFVEGSKEGIETTLRIIPPIVGLIVAIGVFRESGALDILLKVISPITSLFGIPKEVMPLALMRPISGSASLAVVTDSINRYGVDTAIGRAVCIMMGSTETIFYTMAVYFGSVGIKNIRYALPVALVCDLVSLLIAVNIVHIL